MTNKKNMGESGLRLRMHENRLEFHNTT